MTNAARPGCRWQGAAFAIALFVCASNVVAQTATPLELVKKNACFSCHGIVHKQVGPGFAQVAERYRNDAEAPERLAAKIRNGSVGAWGRLIMPRQSLVTEADAQVLVRWILSQPSPPP